MWLDWIGHNVEITAIFGRSAIRKDLQRIGDGSDPASCVFVAPLLKMGRYSIMITSNWKRGERMQGKANSKTAIDPFYWNKLFQLHPTDVCNRTEAIYHPAREGFLLPVYNLRYLVLPKEKEILRMEWNDKPVQEALHPYFYLMVLVYLTEAKDIKPTHTWISEKDLKGGSTFFRGPHRLEVEGLINLFGSDPEAFLKTGKKLGGSEIFFGDKGLALDVFPKVCLAYVLWKGDAEFPPRMSVLFDSTIESLLPLDILWCMVAETSRRLIQHASR
jgi:hypothetical protein